MEFIIKSSELAINDTNVKLCSDRMRNEKLTLASHGRQSVPETFSTRVNAYSRQPSSPGANSYQSHAEIPGDADQAGSAMKRQDSFKNSNGALIKTANQAAAAKRPVEQGRCEFIGNGRVQG